MSTCTPTPRTTHQHPNSLASLLASWRLTDSPVKVQNWRTKQPGGPATSTSGIDQVLREKDQPRSIIYDPDLILTSSFTSFLDRTALPPYYADSALLSQPGYPRTFLARIWDRREAWQTEVVTDYSEDSFNWIDLRRIPLAWVESLDLVLPPEGASWTGGAGRAAASWPPDEYVPPSDGEEEEEENGIFRRLLAYFLDKGPVLTAREFYDFTRQWDPDVFSPLTKAIVSCTSRSARYFVLEDPLCAIFGVLVPVNDPHARIGAGDFDVVLSSFLPLTSSMPPFPQFIVSLYYDGKNLEELHDKRRTAILVAHGRTADIAEEDARAPVASMDRTTRSMAAARQGGGRAGPGTAPIAGPSGQQAHSLKLLCESSTFVLVYSDGATPADPFLHRVSVTGEESLPTSDTSFDSEPNLSTPSRTSLDAPPSPPRPHDELSPFPPSRTAARDIDLPVILHIFDWIGIGATSYAYEALTVGEQSTSYVIKVAKRSDDEPTSFLCEAAILERLKDVDWVCHSYAYLEGADPKCRSVLLLEYGGDAIEKWEELSRDERFELYTNVVTLHMAYRLAHNDLRPPNVVVDPPRSETTTTSPEGHKRRVRLIDFVRASEHECEGEAACEELLVFRRDLGL